MDESAVRYEVADGVATLTLDRPDRRNALSAELVDALLAAVRRLDGDDGARCAVLTGAGDRAFCAGGDLAGMAAEGPLAAWRGRGRFGDLLLALRSGGKPVVAALNGDALGGGLGLALACDMVVAEEHARLGTPEVRVGLFPMVITVELQRNVPRKVMREMVFCGRRLTAAEAMSFHLVNRVVPAGQGLAAARGLAAEVAAFSPAVIRLGREALRLAEDLAYEPAVALLHGRLEANLQAEDAAEGVAAFLQKRAPRWKGR